MMFIICAPAMLILHEALQKLLQVFFENFQSDFSAPKVTSSLQICDVDHNRDILQLKVAALYKLQPIWVDMYVCGYCIFIYLYMHAQTQFTRSSMNVNHTVDIHWILYCSSSFSYESFSISCELTYVGRKLCDSGVCENISTALSHGNTIQCNRM